MYKTPRPLVGEFCLLRFFVFLMVSAGGAEFLQKKAVFDHVLVLAGAVVQLFASRALQFDHGVLGHRGSNSKKRVPGTTNFVKSTLKINHPR